MDVLGDRLIVAPGMLHDYPRLTVQAFEEVCQLLQFDGGVTNFKRFDHDLFEWMGKMSIPIAFMRYKSNAANARMAD